MEAPLFEYSHDRTVLTLMRDRKPVFMNREEAKEHAKLYIGVRSTDAGKPIEIVSVRDDTVGTIYANWQPVKEG